MLQCRVPIIKCSISPPGLSQSVKTDISLGVSNGVKAVATIKQYMNAMEPMRSLILVVKSLLKVCLLHSITNSFLPLALALTSSECRNFQGQT